MKTLTEKEVLAEIKALVKANDKWDNQLTALYKEYNSRCNQLYAEMKPIEKKLNKLYEQLDKLEQLKEKSCPHCKKAPLPQSRMK